ncbi:M48 family peptidase [Psychromonas sp. RZ22]|uniref:YgjP-like metallopeptidase domain-containing protein n=1 Tax=Psychromonas algarum TaxID=2555643 RepID=UPI0010672779|nr:YgjP-like metallopeptidase domain-containing protein [Psychromonas sp. RZ22]TEW55180.1 M48 family peptidase [Psychromonas sp. RZ22]
MKQLGYINHYSESVINQVKLMIENKTLGKYLRKKYPQSHEINTEKQLYQYTLQLKNNYIKQSNSLSKVIYDPKIHIYNNALGTHSFVSRIQGSKLKSKQEIRIASLFKKAPLAMLNMIVVHELAHLKEKQHNKAFYNLCEYILPDYHQVELDTRLFLIHSELFGNLY